MRAYRVAVAFGAMVVLGLSSACGGGGGSPSGTATADEVVPALRIPSQVVGLSVSFEEVSRGGLEAVDRPYVDGVALYGLREGDTLRATLQVSRLNRRARPGEADFRRQVVEQISAVEPTELHVGGRNVYAAGGAEQDIYVWFEGRGMIVLSVHEGFPFPRLLLRRLIEADIGL